MLKQPREDQQPFHSIKAEAILTCSKTGRASRQIPGKGNTNTPHHPASTLTPIYPSSPPTHEAVNYKIHREAATKRTFSL